MSSVKSTRPEWDAIWMEFAKHLAQRSVDPKCQVGAAIVSRDNTQVHAVGYNEDHAGGPNERDSLQTGSSGFIHAEINALIKCDFNSTKDKVMYVTYSPCSVCAKAIINAGIKEVVYHEVYEADKSGLELLESMSITVRKH